MSIAYFDCYNGISGDMTLGALADLGLPIDQLRKALAMLAIDGYLIETRRITRCGIGATQVQVKLEGTPASEAAHVHEHENEHEHEKEHHHEHSHGHEHNHAHEHPHVHDHEKESVHEHAQAHDHGHSHGHDHGHHGHRGFSEIRRIIDGSGFSTSVKQRAIEAFHKIAVAEAAVHETSIEAVHFHEVGAVDAIVDIVGSMWGVEELGITSVCASPIAVGSGTVKAAHGIMPVPAPATARILAGVPIETGPIKAELTTPTGAAIITTLTSTFGPMQNFGIEKIGYGAGSRETVGHTNYLRVLLGKDVRSASILDLPVDHEELALITTEIDDMPAELFAAVMDRLFEVGCLDAQLVSAQMKKARPGTSIHVLCRPVEVAAAVEVLLRETSTFGVKVVPCQRYSLKRRLETVQTPFGTVRVKIGLWDGEVLKRSPEYEDCRRLAAEKKVSTLQVYTAAVAAAWEGE